MTAYIEIGGKINEVFKRNIIVEKDKKEEAIKKYNFKDTYSTVYEYDDKNQERANYVAPLYIDLDADHLERDYEKLRRDVLLLIRKLKTISDIDILDVSHMSRKVIKQGTEDVNIEYFYTEISLKEVDKWTAIEYLINKLNIKKEEVIAIRR